MAWEGGGGGLHPEMKIGNSGRSCKWTEAKQHNGVLRRARRPNMRQHRRYSNGGPREETWPLPWNRRPVEIMHAGKPTGVAVFHCIPWFQTQLGLTTFQIGYHTIEGSS